MSNKNSKESLNSEIDERTAGEINSPAVEIPQNKSSNIIISHKEDSIRESSGKSIRSSRSVRSAGSVQDLGHSRAKLIANGGTKRFHRGMYAPSSPELHNIPPENQVTCAVEIHREKSVTPLSMFGDDMVIGRMGSMASINSKTTDETPCWHTRSIEQLPSCSFTLYSPSNSKSTKALLL